MEFLTKSKQIRTKLEVKYMLIKSKILYMDDDHYYLTPIPSYLYSVFAITEETLPQYEKDCNIEINYTITRETTIQEIQNALCKKMSKQVGLVCRNYFGIYLRTDSDFICIDSFTRRVNLPDYDIIFVDECSTIDNRTMLNFIRVCSH